MKRRKQLSLFPNEQKLFYGGQIVQGQRKSARPLCRKRPIHLVLKAKRNVLLTQRRKIIGLVERYSQRFAIRIYGLSVQHNHIHALVKISDRQSYVAFIRSLSGQMARLLGKGLFKVLPFTRVVDWGRSFRQVQAYLWQNEEEVWGGREYTPRKDYYKRWYERNRKSPPNAVVSLGP